MPAKYSKTDPRRKSLYEKPPPSKASAPTRSTRSREGADDDEDDDAFEDRILKPHPSATNSSPAKAPGKRKKVEWQGEDDTAGRKGAGKRGGAGETKGAEQPAKRRKGNAAAALPPPPLFPVVPDSSFPTFPSLSSSMTIAALGPRLASLVESVAATQGAALDDTYGSGDSGGDYSFLSHYAGLALQGWAADVQKAMGGKASETPRRGRGRQSTASTTEGEQSDAALPFYAHLASALSSTVDEYEAYAAALTSAAAAAAPLAPSLPPTTAAFLSSASVTASGSLTGLIRQGYSSLSVDSDVLIAELRQMKEEVEKHRAWRKKVGGHINAKVEGVAERAEDDEEEEGISSSGRKKREVKKIIKSLMKDEAS